MINVDNVKREILSTTTQTSDTSYNDKLKEFVRLHSTVADL